MRKIKQPVVVPKAIELPKSGTWVKTIQFPHTCDKPSVNSVMWGREQIEAMYYYLGSQWKCAECGQVWEIALRPESDPYQKDYPRYLKKVATK